jgi:hypothetical protein
LDKPKKTKTNASLKFHENKRMRNSSKKKEKNVRVESEGLKHFQFAFHVWKLEYSYRKQIEETSWNLMYIT